MSWCVLSPYIRHYDNGTFLSYEQASQRAWVLYTVKAFCATKTRRLITHWPTTEVVAMTTWQTRRRRNLELIGGREPSSQGSRLVAVVSRTFEETLSTAQKLLCGRGRCMLNLSRKLKRPPVQGVVW
ncbi:hypothetical protein TNCV_547161 [Trichonephila clavipes]|nr:hypothetical protein TNCV_547161 [Trichonephila clavipes]